MRESNLGPADRRFGVVPDDDAVAAAAGAGDRGRPERGHRRRAASPTG